RVLVLLLARDVVALGDDLGRLDHRHVDLRLVLLQPLLAQAMQVHVLVLHETDRLQPARDNDRHPVHDHALRGERDGLHARGTKAVDGHAGRRHREPRAQRRLARDVLARRALRQRAAHDDVLDLAGLEARALDGVRDDVAADGGAVRVVEGSAVRPADRRAGGGDDDGVCHGSLLVLVRRREHYTGRHGAPRRRGSRGTATELVFFAALVVDGALAGALYALVALSFVVVYRASRMINFAVGEWVMLASRLVTFGLHALGL